MAEAGYQISDQHAVHFITFSVIEWKDVFSRTVFSDIIVEILAFCKKINV